VTGFLKISTVLHTRLTAETLLAERAFLHVTLDRQEFWNSRGIAGIPAISKTDGQHFKPRYKNVMMIMMMMII